MGDQRHHPNGDEGCSKPWANLPAAGPQIEPPARGAALMSAPSRDGTRVAPAYCGMTVITGTFICWWYLSRFGLALMIGGWEVALIGGLVALLLGVVFKVVYSRYMRSLGAESA